MLKTITWRMVAFGCSVGVLAGLLVVTFESDFRGHQICEYNQTTEHEDCSTYSLFPFLLIQVGKTLNDYGVAITALVTIAISIFTFTLKMSTDRLWDAGEKQRRLYEDTAERQLRAYILVESATFLQPNGPSDTRHISVILKNFGQTPCYKGIAKFEFEICLTKHPDFVIPITDNTGTQCNIIIGPGHTHFIYKDRGIEVSEDWNALKTAGKTAYVWGRFDYVDAFGRQHFMTVQMFCPFYSSPNFANSKYGNDAD